ncbi:AAA family ATPase [Paenibacillus sp. D51F]
MPKYSIEIGGGVLVSLFAFLLFRGVNIIPLLLALALAGVLLFALKSKGQLAAAGGRREARVKGSTPFSFDDIGGQDRAKGELVEALDFLVKHEEISKLGIRPMKGILLTGPPGTGKTLMAKAAAHYTDSVYLAASGSEFVEMYVGVGAGRIRDLFKEARKKAGKEGKKNAVIFIDEIDVIGGKRDGGSHREYDQTLNQLLTEMDGIHTNEAPRILLIAATNRKEMLDSALLRPGRFDRHIGVDLPDKKGRLHILNIHSKNKPLHDEVNMEKIAEESFGFSGAQLESVLNEGAIYAMREGLALVEQHHLTMAIDKVMMGEKTDRESTKEERERVAIHELGHAIAAELLRPGSVSQVALAPRGGALGYVRHNPSDDHYLYTKDYLEAQIMIALAGAAAEEMFYGGRSTGSRNDFEQSLNIVRTMVECGLTEVGIIEDRMMTPDRWAQISGSVLDGLMSRVKEMLAARRQLFTHCLNILIDRETLGGEQFRKLIASEESLSA